MHFQSTSMNEKKNPSVEVLSTNWFLPVPSIHLNFPITTDLIQKLQNLLYLLVFPKTNIKRRTLRTFFALVFLSLHQPVTKNQKPNLIV